MHEEVGIYVGITQLTDWNELNWTFLEDSLVASARTCSIWPRPLTGIYLLTVHKHSPKKRYKFIHCGIVCNLGGIVKAKWPSVRNWLKLSHSNDEHISNQWKYMRFELRAHVERSTKKSIVRVKTSSGDECCITVSCKKELHTCTI